MYLPSRWVPPSKSRNRVDFGVGLCTLGTSHSITPGSYKNPEKKIEVPSPFWTGNDLLFLNYNTNDLERE